MRGTRVPGAEREVIGWHAVREEDGILAGGTACGLNRASAGLDPPGRRRWELTPHALRCEECTAAIARLARR